MGCRAIVTEALKYLGDKSAELDVHHVLDHICDEKYTNTYQFSPQRVAFACKKVMYDYASTIELALRERDEDLGTKALMIDICEVQTQACLKVDMDLFKGPRLRQNGKLYEHPKSFIGW